MTDQYEMGIIGLGTMGRNLLLNMADRGYSAIGLDRDETKVQILNGEPKTKGHFSATQELKEFVSLLKKPRSLLMLVPAGQAVDQVLAEILPLLDQGDLVIDAGNSHFSDTDRREKKLSEQGFHFFGMGVSGGELGARNGPSMMPGGDREIYNRVRPLFEAIAAHVDGEPCVAYMGPRSAGHYVKMVHNGIEYALMQLIAETYAFMKVTLGLTNEECQKVYEQWNQTELNSYLLEITSEIFKKKDETTKKTLIDLIRGVAKQNGTGMWTSQSSMQLQVPTPTIDAAVTVRDLSTLEKSRKEASLHLTGPDGTHPGEQSLLDSEIAAKQFRSQLLEHLRESLYAGSVLAFSQGMALLQKASSRHEYDLNLESIARIWRGGCIIRCALLEPIRTAYKKAPNLSHLLLDPHIAEDCKKRQAGLRMVVRRAAQQGLPMPAMMASLAYFDGYRSAWLPANLIQAQRDFFGSHTYERIDESGTFHTQWTHP